MGDCECETMTAGIYLDICVERIFVWKICVLNLLHFPPFELCSLDLISPFYSPQVFFQFAKHFGYSLIIKSCPISQVSVWTLGLAQSLQAMIFARTKLLVASHTRQFD